MAKHVHVHITGLNISILESHLNTKIYNFIHLSTLYSVESEYFVVVHTLSSPAVARFK